MNMYNHLEYKGGNRGILPQFTSLNLWLQLEDQNARKSGINYFITFY